MKRKLSILLQAASCAMLFFAACEADRGAASAAMLLVYVLFAAALLGAGYGIGKLQRPRASAGREVRRRNAV